MYTFYFSGTETVVYTNGLPMYLNMFEILYSTTFLNSSKSASRLVKQETVKVVDVIVLLNFTLLSSPVISTGLLLCLLIKTETK